MITSVHITLAGAGDNAAPTPTVLFFSTDVEGDVALLERFIPTATGSPHGGGIRLTWSLPDPAMVLGRVDLSHDEASEYQARNRVSGGVDLLVARDAPGATERCALRLDGFYADWLGALSVETPSDDADRVAPITGLALRRARIWRDAGCHAHAVLALLDELALASRPDGSLTRRAAYVCHEAALLAEAMRRADACEYFETVALMLYPNCHDALIGLALRAQGDPAQEMKLLARAYAVRPCQDDLRLYVRTLARSERKPPTLIEEAFLSGAAKVRLDAPLFQDAVGQPLRVRPAEILAHLRALA
jgi:hypothetical protein